MNVYKKDENFDEKQQQQQENSISFILVGMLTSTIGFHVHCTNNKKKLCNFQLGHLNSGAFSFFSLKLMMMMMMMMALHLFHFDLLCFLYMTFEIMIKNMIFFGLSHCKMAIQHHNSRYNIQVLCGAKYENIIIVPSLCTAQPSTAHILPTLFFSAIFSFPQNFLLSNCPMI